MTLGDAYPNKFTDEEVDHAIAFVKEKRRDLWVKLVDHELLEEEINDIGWDFGSILEELSFVDRNNSTAMLMAVRIKCRKTLGLRTE